MRLTVTNVSSDSRPERPASQRPSTSELPRTTCPRPMARPPSVGHHPGAQEPVRAQHRALAQEAALDTTGMSRDRPASQDVLVVHRVVAEQEEGGAAGAEGGAGGPRAGRAMSSVRVSARAASTMVALARRRCPATGRTPPPSGPPRSGGPAHRGRHSSHKVRPCSNSSSVSELERGHHRGPLHQQVLLAGEPHAGTDATSASLASHRRRRRRGCGPASRACGASA